MASKSITELANAIAEDTAVVNAYYEENNLPQPSFSEDGPPNMRIPHTAPKAAAAQARVLASTRELQALVQGPNPAIPMMQQNKDMQTLQFIYHFGIAGHVPVGSDISFPDLAKAAKVDERTLTRFLRYAFTFWTFRETRPGFVGHTASTRLMKESKPVRDLMGFSINEGVPGSVAVVDAIKRWGASEEPTESGWAYANHATQPFFKELTLRHPERGAIVANALEAYAANVPVDPIFHAYDLSLGGKEPVKIVDIGGGQGPVMIAAAKRYANITCVVQDLPEAIQAAKQRVLPDEVKGRVDFEVHDFFEEQLIKDAGVYFFRAVFHNWPDKYVIKILRALIPALRPGARVVCCEPVLPRPGEAPADIERHRRAVDLNMMTLFNAAERNEDEWKVLFAKADSRLKFQGVKMTAKGPMQWMMPGILECIWEP